jgi:hypothetical protein
MFSYRRVPHFSVVGQFEIVILSKPLLRSEGSGRAARSAAFLGGAIVARLARFLINFKLTHYPFLA